MCVGVNRVIKEGSRHAVIGGPTFIRPGLVSTYVGISNKTTSAVLCYRLGMAVSNYFQSLA